MSNTGKTKQPSGVVLPEPMKRGDEGGSGEYGAAMIRGFNACLREVARLNSSPVSAGDDLTASECSCGDQYPANSYGAGFMAANNGVCENCDAANSCGRGAVDERAAFEALIEEHITLLGFTNETARAAQLALSAPSHGEQVREDTRLLDWLEENLADTIYLDDGRIVDIAGRRTVREAIRESAAAPSAGSQEQE